MPQTQLIKFETFRSSGDPKKDIETLMTMLAKAFGDVYKQLPDVVPVSGEFTSADSPAKTIVVTNGYVTEIR